MTRDPIVEETRRIRREIERELKNEPEAYFKHLSEIQAQWKDRLVRRKPQPAITEMAS